MIKPKTVIFTLALALAAESAESTTCHHYSTWNYPYPQTCGIAHRAAEAKVWYVELGTPEASPTQDQRTAAQIRDFDEHNAIIAKYRIELNNQFEILKMFQDYKQRLRDTTGAEPSQSPEIVQPETRPSGESQKH